MNQASVVWNDLEQQFSHSDIYRIADLQEQLYALGQGTFMVTSYFIQLKGCWDELEMFHPIRHC